MTASQWRSSHDIKLRYRSASFLPGNVVIFNVRGNAYHLETQVAYRVGAVAVTWIGSHVQYMRRHHHGS
ncbi:type II toxin-antitoxin system HigB family toxin [Oxalobacteraceae bacterium A2-2]